MIAQLLRFLGHQVLGTFGICLVALVPIIGVESLAGMRSLAFGERDLVDNVIRAIVGLLIGWAVCRRGCETSIFWVWILPVLWVGYSMHVFLQASVALSIKDFWTATCGAGRSGCEYRIVSVAVLSSAMGYIAGAAIAKKQTRPARAL